MKRFNPKLCIDIVLVIGATQRTVLIIAFNTRGRTGRITGAGAKTAS